MRRSAIPAVLVAGLLALSSCSSIQSDVDASGPPTVTVTTTKPGKAPKPTGSKGSEGKSSKGSSEGDDEGGNAEPSGRGITDVPASEFSYGRDSTKIFTVEHLDIDCISKPGNNGFGEFTCANVESRLPGLYSSPASDVEAQPDNVIMLTPATSSMFWLTRHSMDPSGGGWLHGKPRALKPGERLTLGKVTCTAGPKDLECQATKGAGRRPNSSEPHRMRITTKHIYIDGSAEPLGGTCAPVRSRDGEKLTPRLSRGDADCNTMRTTLKEYLSNESSGGPTETSTGFNCHRSAIAQSGKVAGACAERDGGQYREFTFDT